MSIGRVGRILAWVAGIIGGIVVLLVVAVLVLPWDWLRGPLDKRLSDATHRSIAVDGPLDVHIGLTTRVVADDIRVANTAWGSAPQMVRIKQLVVSVYLPALLRGRMVLPELRLVQPDISLEKNQQGEANWHFANPEAKAVKTVAVPQKRNQIPVVEHMVIDHGRLAYKDPTHGIDLSSDVNTALGGDPQHEHVHLEGSGKFQNDPFHLTMDGGSILALRNEERPYPIKVDAAIGRTQAGVDGTVTQPLNLAGINLQMRVAGNDLADIFPIFGIPIPHTPPYSLEGRLTREGETWAFKDFRGKVGSSDLSGTTLVSVTHGKRPRMTATLISSNLNLKDLAGFVGAKPGKPEETRPDRLLPDTPVNLARLRAMDMDVHFNGRKIEAMNLPFENVNAALKVDDGKATLDPISFGIAKGKLEGTILLNGRQDIPQARINLAINQINLDDFFHDTRFNKEMSGTFGGRFDLSGNGKSTAEILGHSNGRVDLFMGQGRFSNLILDLIGLDVGEALGFLVTKDKPVPVRCMVADFSVKDGLMKADTMVLDTTDSSITGEGTINLADESVDMKLTPHPKSPSVLSARAPILVKGTFKKPAVSISPKVEGARTAAAVALGALLTPLASLLPFIELGLGKDSPCGQLIQQAKSGQGPQQAGAPTGQ